MRRVGGVLLEGREILLADWLVRQAVDYLGRRDGGTLPAGALELRDRLAAFAGRETVAVVVGGERESPAGAAAVIVTESSPQQMTAPAAAALIGVTVQAARGWCRDGTLLATRSPAGHWQVDANSAAEIARQRREGS